MGRIWSKYLGAAVACVAQFSLLATSASAQGAQSSPPQPEIRISVVGGLAGVSQYTAFEEPFWTRDIVTASGGRIVGDIKPFDRSGIRGAEMLPLMRLGVVPFGTALMAVVSHEEPELNAIDLPLVSPDIQTLQQMAVAYRPHLARILQERYDIRLMGLYTYPSQVVYCTKPFSQLADLRGRRIRVSSVGQSELMQALGAIPVITPFAELMASVRGGVVECAVTGTFSGNTIGLHKITSHMHTAAITWGIGLFGINQNAWNDLPDWAKEIIAREVTGLEQRIWEAAGRETMDGIACNAGAAECPSERRGNMTIAPITAEDRALLQRLLRDTILPSWISRCGPDCAEAWNTHLATLTGVRAPQP